MDAAGNIIFVWPDRQTQCIHCLIYASYAYEYTMQLKGLSRKLAGRRGVEALWARHK